MTTIAAIDIGYRNTKYVCQANPREPVRSNHFPSTAVKAEAFPAIGDALAQRDTRLVEVDGMAYEVGPDARLLLGPRSTQVLHEDFIDTPEYRALFLGALSYMGLSEIDVLVGGLPVRHMAAGKSALEAFMQGEHRVPGLGTVTIHRASVVPQPVGGLVHHLRHSAPGARSDDVQLLVDPGFFTLDWTCAEGLKYLPALTGSFAAGISSGLKAVAEIVSEELSVPFSDLDVLDRKLRQPEIRIGGREFDRNRIDEAIRKALRPGIIEMRNQIGSAVTVDRIVLCGGGAGYYEPLIREAWPNHSVVVLEDPLMANVRGFHLLAAQQARRFVPEVAA